MDLAASISAGDAGACCLLAGCECGILSGRGDIMKITRSHIAVAVFALLVLLMVMGRFIVL